MSEPLLYSSLHDTCSLRCPSPCSITLASVPPYLGTCSSQCLQHLFFTVPQSHYPGTRSSQCPSTCPCPHPGTSNISRAAPTPTLAPVPLAGSGVVGHVGDDLLAGEDAGLGPAAAGLWVRCGGCRLCRVDAAPTTAWGRSSRDIFPSLYFQHLIDSVELSLAWLFTVHFPSLCSAL